MAGRDLSEQIDFALRRHYSASCTSEVRAWMVSVIRDWDRNHTDLPFADRQRQWLLMARECLADRGVAEYAKVGVT